MPIPGSISSGTLLTQDLIRRFADALDDHYMNEEYPQQVIDDISLAWDLYQLSRTPGFEAVYDFSATRDLLERLFEHLNDISPPGHYFGAHPGDGADFGWWPIEEIA